MTVEILTGALGIGPNGSTVLYSQNISLGAGAALDWYGVTGVNWELNSGTYWLAFVPDTAISGGVPSSAPNPMVYYAQKHGGGTGWEVVNNIDMGMRASGDVLTPLPAALPLFASGLGFIGFAGWRRKRKALAV